MTHKKLTSEELQEISAKTEVSPDIEKLMSHIRAQDEELSKKYDLLSLSDIARLDNVTRQNAFDMTKRKNFPAPITTVGKQRLWARPDIEKYLEERFT